MTPSTNKFRVSVGIAAVMILSIHICLATAAFFDLGATNPVIKAYRQLILLGPFFSESRIKHSHFLSFQFSYGGKWSEVIEPLKTHFAEYANAPWRMNKTAFIAYERFLANAVSDLQKIKSPDQIQRSKAFRELSAFVIGEYARDHMPPDSVKLVYGLYEYLPADRTYKEDTLFVYKFNPEAIGRAGE